MSNTSIVSNEVLTKIFLTDLRLSKYSIKILLNWIIYDSIDEIENDM